jgi:phenylpropionate dioxygenase-like ring-hydroxylating dioxygenase large terminal subunit
VLVQVCRHHAAAVAQGCGNQASMQFACPYHGWTYGERGPCTGITGLWVQYMPILDR